MNALDRAILALSPAWGLARARARARAQILVRHYEAAAVGRRTQGWPKSGADANAAAGSASAVLRALAHDLVRNNAWARRGLRVIAGNTVGWGIVPKAAGLSAEPVADLWKRWAETTDCDADGRLTFYGLQRLAMTTVAESGEVLIRRRWRRPEDGLAVPLQLQVLEPDLLDSTQDNRTGIQGGPIIRGIEHDAIGRRVAYWLFDQHPGSGRISQNFTSRRIAAEEILHVFYPERPGQVRGVTWFSPILVKLRDFDEYDDATLVRQKIAALFAAFVTDVDGAPLPLGTEGTDAATGNPTDQLEPGMILNLPPGRNVTFGVPPSTSDHPSFTAGVLRFIAAGLGITYEDLTGDYSQMNYSSAKASRNGHRANVEDWRWNMLVPQFCDPAWRWFLGAAALAGESVDEATPAVWTAPPLPMIDPEKEGLALQRLMRNGALIPDEMVREQGYDPEEHWEALAENLKKLDALGIVLDCDPRKVTASGQFQSTGKSAGDDGVGDGEDEPAPPPVKNGKPNGAATMPMED